MPKNVAFHQELVSVGVTAVELLPLNSVRNYLLIQNSGTGKVYLNFSGTATVANGILLEPEDSYEPPVVPTNAISIISDSSCDVVYVEA